MTQTQHGSDHTFRCRECGEHVPASDSLPRCPRCDSRLEVALRTVHTELPGPGPTQDIHRYDEFLATAGIEPVGLQSGWTPLLELPRFEAAIENRSAVYLKNETIGPTWSWKDRLAALLVPHAVATGATRIATSSSGNHGAAIAAAAARMGVEETVVFLSPSSDAPHCRRISACGARAILLRDHGEVRDLLGPLHDQGWFVAYDLRDRFTGQPYVYDAYATIAFELVEQLGTIPQTVSVPVGSGDGLYGIWTGFRRLERAGITDGTPRMIGAEAAERQPLTRAVASGAERVGDDPGPEPLSTSTMGTTAGNHALAAIRESNGTAIALTREEMGAALRTIARDGIFLEPASALAAGAARRDIEPREDPEGPTVIIGTGAGIGWPDKTASVLEAATTIDPSLDALEDALSD